MEFESAQPKSGQSENKIEIRGDEYPLTDLNVREIKEVRVAVGSNQGKTDQEELYEPGRVQALRSRELVLSPDGIRAVLSIRGSRSAFSYLFARESFLGTVLALIVFWGGLVAAHGLKLPRDDKVIKTPGKVGEVSIELLTNVQLTMTPRNRPGR